MKLIEKVGLRLLHCADPEEAHGIALKLLARGVAGGQGAITSPRLKTMIAGLTLPNPVGASAGFDKNAVAVNPTLKTGFGFCEVGAVTPRPQAGNPKPRLFRLTEDRAVINRFGFNNAGMDVIHANLTRAPRCGIVGVNLGANKETEDKAEDYIAVLRRFHGDVDFATVNVSSPNTEKLRDLQGRAALDALLARILEARDALGSLPVFLKIAPDLDDAGIGDIAKVCLERGVDGIIATNTTLARTGLQSKYATEAGGLSGAPLFEASTDVLRRLARETRGQIPLIGVGGISSAEQAYKKIKTGAAAVQLYSAMVYEGVSLGARIAQGLDDLLARDGLSNVSEAVGAEV